MRPLERVLLASYSAPNGGTYAIPAQGKLLLESAVMFRIYSYSLIPGTSEFQKYRIQGFQNSRIPKIQNSKNT